MGPLKPRFPRIFSHMTDFIAYADAALLNNRIEALIMASSNQGPLINLLCESPVPKFRKNKFSRRDPIIGMEMLAPLALFYTAAHRFLNKRVNLYIDNDKAANTLIIGDPHDPVLSATIGAFWKKSEQLSADIWIGRVASEVGPSGLPDREKQLHFTTLEGVRFKNLFTLQRTTLREQSCLAKRRQSKISLAQTFDAAHTLSEKKR